MKEKLDGMARDEIEAELRFWQERETSIEDYMDGGSDRYVEDLGYLSELDDREIGAELIAAQVEIEHVKAYLKNLDAMTEEERAERERAVSENYRINRLLWLRYGTRTPENIKDYWRSYPLP